MDILTFELDLPNINEYIACQKQRFVCLKFIILT